jgi:hypothetical protein
MPSYMLLLYDNPANWQNISPEEMQKALEKYIAWGSSLRQQGVILASHKLADDAGKVMRGHGQTRVTDGPYSETKEVLGGYYLIKAATYSEAVERARDCPHLEFGGTVEVRQVDPMSEAVAA